MIPRMLFCREIGKKYNRREVVDYAERLYFVKECNFQNYIELPNTKCTLDFCLSHDGEYLASLHGNHNINILEVKSRKLVMTLIGHIRPPWCAAFHPRLNSILVSGCMGGNVIIWKLVYKQSTRGYILARFDKPKYIITSIVFHSRDNCFLFSSESVLYFWHLSDSRPRKSIRYNANIKYLKLIDYDSVLLIGFESMQHIFRLKILSVMKTEIDAMNEEYYQTLNAFGWQPLRNGILEMNNSFRTSNMATEVSLEISQKLYIRSKNMDDIIISVYKFLTVKYKKLDKKIERFKNLLIPAIRVSKNYKPNASNKTRNLSCVYLFLLEYVQKITENPSFYTLLKYIHTALVSFANLVPKTLTASTKETWEMKCLVAIMLTGDISKNFFKVLTYIDQQDLFFSLMAIRTRDDREFLFIMLMMRSIMLMLKHYIEIYWIPTVKKNMIPNECNVEITRLDLENAKNITFRFHRIWAINFSDSRSFPIERTIDVDKYSNNVVIPSCTIHNTTSVAVTDKHQHLIVAVLNNTTIGVYSYGQENFGQFLYMLSSVNKYIAISLGISTYENHLIIAARKMYPTNTNMFLFHKFNEDGYQLIIKQISPIRVNAIRFLKNIFEGFVIGNSSNGILQCYSSP